MMKKIGYFLYTAKDEIKERGWSTFLFKILPWMRYRRYYVYAADVENIPEFPPPSSELHFKSADYEDIEAIRNIRPFYYADKTIRQRLDKGHVCFTIWKGSDLIHLRWLFFHGFHVPYLNRDIVLAPTDFYADEAYTVPEFRRKGIMGWGAFHAACTGKERGGKRYVTMFASWNTNVYKMAEKIGFRRIGECGYRLYPGKKRYFWKGEVQKLNHEKITIIANR